ncbi:MAG: NAD(P)-dependent oxidoreductase [Candidatus Sulfotelmatobacter sp.]
MADQNSFRVALSADFLDEQGNLIFPDVGLSLLEAEGIHHEFLRDYHSEYLPVQLSDCDVLITMKPKVTANSLQGVERLCAIGRVGVGYDNVDLAACTENDVAVYITPAGVVRPMASSIVLMVLALSHNLVIKDRMMRQGRWVESTRKLGREPRDRVIGTIGLGNIAHETLRLLRNFTPARFLAFDPYVTELQKEEHDIELVPLETLLRHSDYVLVNCPLNKETRHLMGERELKLMKSSAVLINTARGAIVDQVALIHSLQTGVIAGAALDVFEQEPLENDSPLLQLDNVILTSHSVGWTEELFRDMGRIDCQGAIAISRGQAPHHIVNREVLGRPGFRKKLERFARSRR